MQDKVEHCNHLHSKCESNEVCAGLLTWTSTVSRGANFVVLFKNWLIKRSMVTSKGHRYPDLYVSQ